jgi:alkaline phosphatase D
MRVLHLSDPHLSPGKPENRANAHAALPAILKAMPDLIVITGDLTEDGYREPGEFCDALPWLNALPCPWVLIPGNHDVGNFAGVGEPADRVTAGRVEQFCECFGHDRFAYDADGWVLLGINALLMGSGLSREADQMHWLEQTLGRASEAQRRVALFMHSPLFLRSANEPQDSAVRYWCPPAPARDALLGLLSQHRVELLASGHCHQNRHAELIGKRIVWSPALSGSQVLSQTFPPDAYHQPAAPLFVLSPKGLTIEPVALPLQTRQTRLS